MPPKPKRERPTTLPPTEVPDKEVVRFIRIQYDTADKEWTGVVSWEILDSDGEYIDEISVAFSADLAEAAALLILGEDDGS